jgi:hypothetical protein
MSLLLTCYIDQYDIDVPRRLRRGFGPDRLRAARQQPLADQLAMQPVMLDDQYALQAGLRR